MMRWERLKSWLGEREQDAARNAEHYWRKPAGAMQAMEYQAKAAAFREIYDWMRDIELHDTDAPQAISDAKTDIALAGVALPPSIWYRLDMLMREVEEQIASRDATAKELYARLDKAEHLIAVRIGSSNDGER
jgi:hypothetical protein